MTENTENTLTSYLGVEFQQRLMWQLLVEPEFAEKILPDLAIEYFDDPNLKRLFIIILEYFKEFEKVPNLQNQSIHQAINAYKTPNNTIEEESLFAVLKRISMWNERIINKQMLYDGDAIQKAAKFFVKQQEYRKLAEHVQSKVKDGGIREKHVVAAIEDRFTKISHIGEDDDDAKSVGEGLRNALRKEFRQTIPTGIETIDVLTGGGLGKGEIGVVLTPSGVGKTTFLTKVANQAFELEKNVAQIIFEDTKEQIQRKHSVIWAESALSRINDDDDEIERVFQIADAKCRSLEGKGRLIVKRFSQEDTTMKDIRNWMTAYEKKWGFKFDILVLDYLDCVESHKRGQERTESELTVIKGFEALAADFNIPAWTAIQSNRSGFGSEFVEAHQSGGSIKRIQKAHFFMSIAKTQAQQEANFANIRIIKARFAKDGQAFEDCVFNNDTMQIIIDDPRYRYTKTYKDLKRHDEKDVDKLNNKAEGLSKIHAAINEHNEGALVDKLNDEVITEGRTEAQVINDLLHKNNQPEANDDIKPDIGFEKQLKTKEQLDLEASSDERKMVMPEEVPKVIGDLIVLDESKDIETVDDAVNDAVSEGVSDAVKPDLLDFTGDTTTITTPEPEPVITESPPLSEHREGNTVINGGLSAGLTTPESPPSLQEEMKIVTREVDEVMKLILSTDPKASDNNDEDWKNHLIKKRDYQSVKKKE